MNGANLAGFFLQKWRQTRPNLKQNGGEKAIRSDWLGSDSDNAERKISNSTLNIHLSFHLHIESEKLHKSLRQSTNLRLKKLLFSTKFIGTYPKCISFPK